MFIERILYKHVKERLAWYIADPARFERFLLTYGNGAIDADEAAAAREAFEDNPPTAVHGYARQGGPFPCFALVLGAESTIQDYLGENVFQLDEDGEEYIDADTGEPVDVHAKRWDHRFDWYVYEDHPDQCLYYYYLLRHMMVGLRSRLQAEDLDEITYQGAELAPDPRYMPANMFTRRFSITCRADEDYVEDYSPDVGKGTSIVGLHGDDGPEIPDELTEEEQEDLAATQCNVTTFTEGDDA